MKSFKIMRIQLLKLTIIVSLGALFAIYSLNGSPVEAFSSGPFPSLTGAPGESSCRDCHGGGPTGGTLSINGLPATYSPNQEITLTVRLAQQNRLRFGFQLTAIDDAGKRAGDLIPNDNRAQTQTNNVNGNQRQYINHTGQGNAPTSSGQGSWTFRWRAPAQIVGRVTFYVAGNAANGNFSTTGDTIYTTNLSIQPSPTLTNLTSVSAASFTAQSLASEAIVAAFGRNLAAQLAVAETLPLPTTLAGTTVKVRDSAGVERLAPLFFVAPAQINYQIPEGAAPGEATVTITSGDGQVSTGMLNIADVAPGLFSAASSGQGVAAAVVLRVKADGAQSYEPVARYDAAQNRFVGLPIDLGEEGDQVFLLLYGTGFRHHGDLAGVTVKLGDVETAALFAGGLREYAGLDQLNLRIPRSLAGRGEVDIALNADGHESNRVKIHIR